MAKKRLRAAQGIEAACILFQLNSKEEDILRLATEAGLPAETLPPADKAMLCLEWQAFTHAVLTSGLMQYAPNSVLVGYLRETGNLLAQTRTGIPQMAQADFVDGPFAAHMALLGHGRQAECPTLFCRRLAEIPHMATAAYDKHVEARLAALMAMVISAVWDKLDQYEILAD
ncbi:MAG: serine/threonine protein kinase [Desulfovibrio sp.]|nr:serine/threonine protein kinase [Desulfovibrio sp.]